ncbi:group II intron reverse transcriptase domain-containing protein [Chroococcidiopsis sp. FACHB-1243]|uniref:antiviral reverse transcriptase Drt2 n=1 Tax=Chroococcidiopsis sp. [FACHB-1243] TaxID=2692781 RepID=UPI00177F4AA0|nr:antiviral reverse transcriptase Drt2 [Chroococcidiopsis sp. [FACHB-1243]]MBD2304003.1 group II intron reverse transcriptase domain-containing protein [Chroococcidiopsis sp. [FACHB-1243]]
MISNSFIEPSEKWFKTRGYIHFDSRVSRIFAEKYVWQIKNIETHSFLPFLSYKKKACRYKSKDGKTEQKKRKILYASHLDSHIYAWYSYCLSQQYEQTVQKQSLNECVLAYRTLGRCNIDFSKEVFDEASKRTPCTAIAFDISSFFDSIDHKILKNAWCSLLGVTELPLDHYKVYKSITKYAYADRDTVFQEFKIENKQLALQQRICSSQEFRERIRGKGLIQTNKTACGIPQGSPISAILSNVFLIEFDRLMTQIANDTGGIYRRYCDDILLICQPDNTEDIKTFVAEEISKYSEKLFLNHNKTEICEFRRDSHGYVVGLPPLQYLGFTFDGQRRLIRSQALARYYRKMKAGVRATVKVALKSEKSQVYRKTLYEKYTHLGRRNFITYAMRAAEIMESDAIRRQVRSHWKQLHDAIDESST